MLSLITWQDTAQEDAPVAGYAVDFAVDGTWQWAMEGAYLGQPVVPRGVTIDNTGNGTNVVVTLGNTNVTVFAYTRDLVAIGPGIRLVSVTGASPAVIPVTFFVKDPPASGAQQNLLAVQRAVTAALQTTEFSISGSRTLGATDANSAFVCTGALTLTLPLTTTVDTHYVVQVYAQGGAVILKPNAADRIEGQAIAVTLTLPQGGSTLLVTDGAGSWWCLYGGLNDSIAGTFTANTGAFQTVTVAGRVTSNANATGRVIDAPNLGYTAFFNQANTTEWGRISNAAGFQMAANNAPLLSGIDNVGTSRELIRLDNGNNATLRGPTSATGWRMVNNAFSQTLWQWNDAGGCAIVHTNTNGLQLSEGASTVNTIGYQSNLTRTGSLYAVWNFNGVAGGNIAPNGSGGANYNTTSARELKDLHGAVDGTSMGQLPVHMVTFKAFPGRDPFPSVLYDEVLQVAPECCTAGQPAAWEGMGPPEAMTMPAVPDSVDYSKLVPRILAYAQSLERRLAALEAGG